MREGVAMCVLGRRWSCLWRTSSLYSLSLTASNLLGYKLTRDLIIAKDKELEQRRSRRLRISHFRRRGFLEIQRTNFITRVNQILKLRCASSLISDKFLISFPLGNESASHVDEWMMLAAAQGVRELVLNFNWSDCVGSYDEGMYYRFPFQLFGASLKYLRLRFCTFKLPPSFKNLNLLVTLSLTTSSLTSHNLQAILSNCPLEFLSLRDCYFRTPTLKCVRPPATTLKRLYIDNCLGVYEIELQDPNLSSLDLKFDRSLFHSGPNEMKLSIKGAPLLKRLALNAGPFWMYDISVETRRSLPRLETLFLKHQVRKLPKLRAFSNLKRLVFSAKYDNSNLFEVLCFLEACPLLQHLHVDMRSVWDVDYGLTELSTKVAMACAHNCLKKVEMYGFDGHSEQIELAKYLLSNAIMKISTTWKSYLSCGKWTYS